MKGLKGAWFLGICGNGQGKLFKARGFVPKKGDCVPEEFQKQCGHDDPIRVLVVFNKKFKLLMRILDRIDDLAENSDQANLACWMVVEEALLVVLGITTETSLKAKKR